jgi:Raf kinase inhibitor-like YbhB/YbcL family protein
MNTKQRIIPVGFLAAIFIILGCGLVKSMEPILIPEATPTLMPELALMPTSTREPASTPIPPFTLTSTAFKDGETIPAKYGYIMTGQCSGENYSPPLSWTGTPAGTQSFTVTMIDPDGGNWVHWMQFNIPSEQNELPEEVGGPDIGIKGVNSFHKNRYGGPCPPSGTHKYIFTLYALDTLLSLPQGATKAEVAAAMQGHILQQAQLTGIAQR